MTDSFMTTEGDRSGVNTPPRRDKAKNRLLAFESHVHVLVSEWDGLSDSQIETRLHDLRNSLRLIATEEVFTPGRKGMNIG